MEKKREKSVMKVTMLFTRVLLIVYFPFFFTALSYDFQGWEE